MKRIYFTVTNDLNFDQRMHRICGSLAQAGYDVCLVGRKRKNSLPLAQRPFRQKRLRCWFDKGALFYAEYNVRLFFFLLFRKMDAVCSIDLDTILPGLFISKLKRIPRIYDAHEYFTELKEVHTRPAVQKLWLAVEKFAVPKFRLGYTVSEGLAQAFHQQYGRDYLVVRNVPVLRPLEPVTREKVLIYQGAVNEGRGFEYLIPAMKQIPYPLVVCGDGNFMPQLKQLIQAYGVQDKVRLMGMLPPEALWPLARKAALGIGLAEREGTNQFLALPNKFMDYIQACLPQIAPDFPEYQKVNERYPVAVLLDELSVNAVAETINRVMADEALLHSMERACTEARLVYCWQQEEKILTDLYQHIFAP